MMLDLLLAVFVSSAVTTTDSLGQAIGPGREPRWSVDGTRLVYSHDGGLHVAEVDGAPPVRIIENGVPPAIWWNDDSEIIYTRYAGVGGQELWIANADGSDQRVWSGSDSGGPFATNDSSKLAWWTEYDVTGNGDKEECYLVNDYVAQTTIRVLCDSGFAGLHWHPDRERWVGHHNGRPIIVTIPDESVTYFDDLPGFEGLPDDASFVHMSPDGLALAYHRTVSPPDGPRIFVWRDGKETQITEHPRTAFRAPRWSPDGTRLAYHSTSLETFVDSVRVIAVPGDTPVKTVSWSDVKATFGE